MAHSRGTEGVGRRPPPARWSHRTSRADLGRSGLLPSSSYFCPRRPRFARVYPHEAAKESNLPSGGLHRPAGFEDQTGHQTPAAPRMPSLVRALVSRQVPIAVAAQPAFGVQPFEQGLGVFAAEAEGVADLGDAGRAAALGEGDDEVGELLVDSGGKDDVGLGADGLAGGGKLAEGRFHLATLGFEIAGEGGGTAWAGAV